jgi:3-phosphoshikimate 1-carboxyvinyltransferase
MKLKVKKSRLDGILPIPGSKSHTIRRVVIAGLANGESVLRQPLRSADTLSTLRAAEALGAEVKELRDSWQIKGFGGHPRDPGKLLDLGNSGTGLRLLTSAAALGTSVVPFDGDESLRTRPMEPLLAALRNLGVKAQGTGKGYCPLQVQGPLTGGRTEVSGLSSQFLSSLLISAPCAPGKTEITVAQLNEQPYVHITLHWLKRQGIIVEYTGLHRFVIPGGQRYKPFDLAIPADFSSATFGACAGAMGGRVRLTGLDMTDPQGDKGVLDMLRLMGATVTITETEIIVEAKELVGTEIDLNATPDALPALAVTATQARGETRLVNVPQARIKETDRIMVMAKELSKMGADIRELPDGLVIRQSKLKGAVVHGHADHRIVMSLALAGMQAEGETIIDTAESIDVTYPGFVESFRAAGAAFVLIKE